MWVLSFEACHGVRFYWLTVIWIAEAIHGMLPEYCSFYMQSFWLENIICFNWGVVFPTRFYNAYVLVCICIIQVIPWVSREDKWSLDLCWRTWWSLSLHSKDTLQAGPASVRCTGSARQKQNPAVEIFHILYAAFNWSKLPCWWQKARALERVISWHFK